MANQLRTPKLFPACCLAGHSPFLVEIAREAHEQLGCPICGGEAKLIPGAYYTGLSRDRFDRVARSVHASGLTPKEAAARADELAMTVKLGTRASVERVLESVPKLEALKVTLPYLHHDLVNFVSLLRTLLEVYADAPRNEGGKPGGWLMTHPSHASS